MDGANLDEARIDGAKLRNAYMRGASMVGAVLDNADFSHARLEWSVLRCAWMDGTDFSNADLGHATLERAQPSAKTDFSKSNLSLVLFCNPTGSGYEQGIDSPPPGSVYGRSHVSGIVRGARFFAADLRGCSIDFVGWEEADFSYANIHGVTKAPAGFIERAKAKGAVAIQPFAQWRKMWGSGSHPGFSAEATCPNMPPEFYSDTPK